MSLPSGAEPWSLAPAMHLIWFHHAGGHGQSYRAMAALLPSHWPVSLMEYPGRGAHGHVPARDNLADLVDGLLPQVLQRVHDTAGLPFGLFGHSMGALVAHEVARRLHAGRQPMPAWLGVSGHRAPDMLRPSREWLHPLPDHALIERLRQLGALPAHTVTPAYLSLMRADLRACETRSAPPLGAQGDLPCALSTFTGDADPMAPAAMMPPWSRQVRGCTRHHVLPGGHFFLAGVQRRRVIDLIVQDLVHARLQPPSVSPSLIHHASRTSPSHHARIGH